MEFSNLPAVVFETITLFHRNFQGLLINLSPTKPEILISKAPLVAEKLPFSGGTFTSEPPCIYTYVHMCICVNVRMNVHVYIIWHTRVFYGRGSALKTDSKLITFTRFSVNIKSGDICSLGSIEVRDKTSPDRTIGRCVQAYRSQLTWPWLCDGAAASLHVVGCESVASHQLPYPLLTTPGPEEAWTSNPSLADPGLLESGESYRAVGLYNSIESHSKTNMKSHCYKWRWFICLFIHAIYIAPFKVHYYSEALPTQHVYYVGVSRRSATGNCEWRTCPRFLRGG